MKYSFYATFEEDKEDGGYNVQFSDLGVSTCGDKMDETIYMSEDVLKLMLDQGKARGTIPSTFEEMVKKHPNKMIKKIEVEWDK